MSGFNLPQFGGQVTKVLSTDKSVIGRTKQNPDIPWVEVPLGTRKPSRVEAALSEKEFSVKLRMHPAVGNYLHPFLIPEGRGYTMFAAELDPFLLMSY